MSRGGGRRRRSRREREEEEEEGVRGGGGAGRGEERRSRKGRGEEEQEGEDGGRFPEISSVWGPRGCVGPLEEALWRGLGSGRELHNEERALGASCTMRSGLWGRAAQ
ncbi:hypothetical protein NHX12_011873 [Muraenolepis orangiensis]|uniref:Uncharacterized protein n=1 Tax=Muraenolepis orangiensis TaxID=630683 RepID=A0A9Q0I7M2_9TELE|nr:hypothetical protein NHX12_011873 [Muraenolepis orangiensis]